MKAVLSRLRPSSTGALSFSFGGCGPFVLWLVGCAASPAAAGAGSEAVRYEVALRAPQTQMVELAMEFEAGGPEEVVSLPVWRPGRYSVLDPVGTLRNLRASGSEGEELEVQKVDKTSWKISTGGAGRVRVSYEIYANSISDRTRHVDATHAFLSGSSVFLFSERLRGSPVLVELEVPAGWGIATGLETVAGRANTLQAADYDVLVDSPIEVGLHEVLTFEHEGVPHEIVVWPRGVDYHAENLIEDFGKIVAAQVALFGRMPYERYVFLIHVGAGGGGTEHLNSTIMQTSRRAMEGSHERTDAYKSLLGLTAHEFYHTYNVKQLRPAGIHPYDYLKENYTDLLWVAEGSTSYYGPLSMVHAGITKEGKYLERLSGAIHSLRRHPGARVQSLSQSSFDAWTKFNVGSPDDVNSEVSFYSKGALASLLLDLELRRRTEGKVGFDAVMKAMFERFPLSGPGYTTDDLLAVLEEMTGSSFEEFFDRYIEGVELLPFEEVVGVVGLELRFEPAKKKGDGEEDGGESSEEGAEDEEEGEDEANPEEPELVPYLGLDLRDGETGAVVRSVRSDGPAYLAGVLAGDEIVALDGRRLRASHLEARLERKELGQTVTLHLLRRDELLVLEVALGGVLDGKWKLSRVKEPTEQQKANYAAWIGRPWPTKKAREEAEAEGS